MNTATVLSPSLYCNGQVALHPIESDGLVSLHVHILSYLQQVEKKSDDPEEIPPCWLFIKTHISHSKQTIYSQNA
jgi:hypothetical protein